jgi:hypothetical protein
MVVEVESGIEFTYTPPASFIRHDTNDREWPAIDFIIDEGAQWIWLEVKNWEPSALPPRFRGGNRRSFLSKMRSNSWFSQVLRGKFLGTCAFLAHAGTFQAKDLVYVALLESPRMDSALMLHASSQLEHLVQIAGPWQHKISAAVMNVTEWNLRFPEYSARRVWCVH